MDETRVIRARVALGRVEDLVTKIPWWSDLADVVWLCRTLQKERRLPAPMSPASHTLRDMMRVRLTPSAVEWFPLIPRSGVVLSSHPLAGRAAVRFDGEAEPRLVACEWLEEDRPDGRHGCATVERPSLAHLLAWAAYEPDPVLALRVAVAMLETRRASGDPGGDPPAPSGGDPTKGP